MLVPQSWAGVDSDKVIDVLLLIFSIVAAYFVVIKLLYIGKAMKAKAGQPKG